MPEPGPINMRGTDMSDGMWKFGALKIDKFSLITNLITKYFSKLVKRQLNNKNQGF